jgi:hypothetical protein
MTAAERRIWYENWVLTEEGIAYQAYEQNRRIYGFRVERDGSFRIDDVAPGTYELILKPWETPPGRRPLATATRTVVVAEIPGGRSDIPLDLGAVEMLNAP